MSSYTQWPIVFYKTDLTVEVTICRDDGTIYRYDLENNSLTDRAAA